METLFFLKKIIPVEFHTYFRHLYFKYLKRGRFSLNNLDKKLEHYINYENGFYIELGANNGFEQSNTYYFQLKKKWQGILIEPSPHLFINCLRLRGDKNKVYCNACVGFDFKDKYVDIEYANLTSISANLDIDVDHKEELLNVGRKFLKSKHEAISFGAKARTLNSILEESDAPTLIDLLSLDVEGAELEVLKGIDFNKFSFKFMLIECRNIERLTNFLSQKGYKVIDQLSKHDYLFHRSD